MQDVDSSDKHDSIEGIQNQCKEFVVLHINEIEDRSLGTENIQTSFECASSTDGVGEYVRPMQSHDCECGAVLESWASSGKPITVRVGVKGGIWIFGSEVCRSMKADLLNQRMHLLNLGKVVLVRIFFLEVEYVP